MSAKNFVLNKKKQGNVEVLQIDGVVYQIRLHNNVIVERFDDNDFRLFSCNYKTPTTKRALNRFLKLIDAPFEIYQDAGCWFIRNTLTGYGVKFSEGIKTSEVNEGTQK